MLAAAALAGVAAAGGCGGGLGERSVNVFAASSLTDVFAEIAEAFKRDHPDVEVVLQFAGSSRLAAQIAAGARADVFASANERVMEDLLREMAGQEDSEGSIGVAFARNRLALAVPTKNPGRINGLASLGKPDLLVAACDPEVPCGALAEEILTAAGAEMGVCPSSRGSEDGGNGGSAGVEDGGSGGNAGVEDGERGGCDAARLVVDTHEPNVRSVLTKVMLGEVDAGLVYATDLAAGGEDVFGIGLRHPAAASYLLAVLSEKAAAAEFTDFVMSPPAREILAEAGFLPP